MKATLTILLIAASSMAVVPPTQDVLLICDARPANEQVRAYRFYEYYIGYTNLLGSSPTNGLILSNVLVAVQHRYGVSASNVFGESDISVPYVAPVDPRPPLRLRTPTTNGIVLQGSLDGGTTWNTLAVVTTNSPVMFQMQKAQMFRSDRTNLPPMPPQ